ncbi:MAG: deoxyhypusine synthase [Magnetococcus sp. DMHC-1]
MIDNHFIAYNARQLADACKLVSRIANDRNITVGLSISGALIPAGVGYSSIIPLMKHGFVDWIVSTGANLYHDMHHFLGHEMYRGNHVSDDSLLHKDGIVRIYDLYLESQALYDTDKFIRESIKKLIGRKSLKNGQSSSDLHYQLGAYMLEMDDGADEYSVLAAGAKYQIPIHCSAPADSGIGMNLAALIKENVFFSIDQNYDVLETASYVHNAKKEGGSSAVVILGGGSPKNFLLQTEPFINEVLGIKDVGHDYFIQFTDARPDTGGLSGATPSEAVSWGKIDPNKLPGTIVCYGDCTVYAPLVTQYVMDSCAPREMKNLYQSKGQIVKNLLDDAKS